MSGQVVPIEEVVARVEAERERVVAEAAHDPELRERLKTDPWGLLAERARIRFDPAIRPEVVVLEETADRRYIVLPYVAPTEEDQELSDADLALVAGGSASGYCQQTASTDCTPC